MTNISLENVSPTRINLIQTRKTLNLAESGRDILERKRDILLRELRNSLYDAEHAREKLNEALKEAYINLKQANLASGSETVANNAIGSSYEADFLVDFRSVMGVTVPIVEHLSETDAKPDYGFANTSVELDNAFKRFQSLLEIVADLASAEGAVYQIAYDVRRTQRRVNALNEVIIPLYRRTVKQIELVLEEREREEFVRTKRIKEMIKEGEPF